MEMTNNIQSVNYDSKQGSYGVSSAAPASSEPKKIIIDENSGKTPDKTGVASDSAIKKAVEQINKNAGNSEAIFGFHDETNRVTIKIINKETKDVIKEYPAEETLDMIAKVWEMAGIMVDEKR